MTFNGDRLSEAKGTGPKLIEYIYNGKIYKYIGDKLPEQVNKGFFLPIKKALWNGRDVTELIKQYAGPRQDFFGKMPDTSKLFYTIKKRRWRPHFHWSWSRGLRVRMEWLVEYTIEPEPGILEVQNIMGQSILGAK